MARNNSSYARTLSGSKLIVIIYAFIELSTMTLGSFFLFAVGKVKQNMRMVKERDVKYS